jgi:hypothetical protein
MQQEMNGIYIGKWILEISGQLKYNNIKENLINSDDSFCKQLI